MHFIYVLVIAVAILTMLAGIALVLGTSKSERFHSLWFLIAGIGEAIWAFSITIFLSIGSNTSDYELAPWLVLGIYIGALIMDAALITYISWKSKHGKTISLLFATYAIILTVLLAYDPSVLYSKITLADTGNSVTIDIGVYYIAYLLFFVMLNTAIFIFLFNQIRTTKRKELKHGYLFFLIGLAATGVVSGIFDLILPMIRYDLIWVGPITIGLTILGFYFAILKYKMVSIKANWLKVLSGIVIANGAFIVYLLIFNIVFSALFKVANPSYQVILLNFIMIAIVLALVPALSEITNLTKSLIMTKQINLPYIVKKLSSENRKRINLKDISSFLSEYMHFSYVGFLVKGKFYATENCKLSNECLAKIANLPSPSHGAWQDISRLGSGVLKETEISRIAIMSGSNGEIVGQMIFGRPVSKNNLEHKELVEITMIVSLMGTIIEDGSRSSKS